MANDRDELQRLREIDRMAELEAKAAGHAAPAEEPGAEETSIPGLGKLGITGALVDAAGGSSNAIARGLVNKASLGNIAPPQLKDDETSFPLSSAAGKGAGMAATAVATGSPAAAMESAGGRVAMSGMANGLSGFLQKPEGEDGLASRTSNGGIAALLGVAGQTLGEVGHTAGDYLMQKAVGMKKYMPGMGTRIADEGVVGTKGMMRGQVDKVLPSREAELQDAVSRLKGNIEPEAAANALRAKASPYSPAPGPSGPMPAPAQNQPFISAAHSRADEALARGAVSPDEALSLSRAIAKPAYSMKSGDPLDSFKSQLSQAEGGSLKDTLKAMADEQNVPEVRQALASEQALLNAKRGLNKPETMSESLMPLLGKTAGGAGLGALLSGEGHHTEGAIAGAAASTPLAKSGAAQALVRGSRLAPYLTPAIQQTILRKMQK